jgi:hypothetical protein
VVATYGGKHLNSPNDVAAHSDGSVWFTDPPFGEQMYEGVAGGPGNQAGHLRSRVGQPADIGTLKRELPASRAFRLPFASPIPEGERGDGAFHPMSLMDLAMRSKTSR